MDQRGRKMGVVDRHGTRRTRASLLVSVLVGLAMLASPVAWIAFSTEARAGEAPTFRGGARLTVDKELIDLGAQPDNRVVEARFQLKNIGDHPLQLPPSPPVEVVEGC